MKNTDALLEKYIRAAIDHGEASIKGDYRIANRQYAILKRIYKHLEKDRQSADIFLASLLCHDNPSVRVCAAAHALGLQLKTDDAIGVLQQILLDQKTGNARLNAEMLLKEWKEKRRIIL